MNILLLENVIVLLLLEFLKTESENRPFYMRLVHYLVAERETLESGEEEKERYEKSVKTE